MSAYFMVFFDSSTVGIESAISSCKSYGLEVETSTTGFITYRKGSPKFEVDISGEPHVLEEAREIAEGSEFEAAMENCSIRFEVTIDDFSTAIDEIDTMMDVQGALQDVSKGYLYLPWNGTITEPWEG